MDDGPDLINLSLTYQTMNPSAAHQMGKKPDAHSEFLLL